VNTQPVLWHYTFSNYNEKIRWTLDHRRIPHTRRNILPGSPRALWFSSRGTVPLLDLDGRRIMDSTRIIEALERRFEGLSLYPDDPAARDRALELEDFFDEQVGHDVRRVAFWDMREVDGFLPSLLATGFGDAGHAFTKATSGVAWAYASRRYTFTEADAERSRERIVAGLDRIESERAGGDHLVGEELTVADITAASLCYPLAWPDELQYSPPRPAQWKFRESLAVHPAVGWIAETYRRHRGVSAEVSA
jgi:glutathione S-transferase